MGAMFVKKLYDFYSKYNDRQPRYEAWMHKIKGDNNKILNSLIPTNINLSEKLYLMDKPLFFGYRDSPFIYYLYSFGSMFTNYTTIKFYALPEDVCSIVRLFYGVL